MQQLEVLKSASMIDDDVFDFAKQVILFLEEKYEIETGMETVIIHLAMASQRIRNGAIVDEMGEEIFESVKESDHYEEASKLWMEIKSFTEIIYPYSEEQYMLLHLCNILNQ